MINKVKLLGTFTCCFVVFLILPSVNNLFVPLANKNVQVEIYYSRTLEDLKKLLITFRTHSENHSPVAQLRLQFKKIRLAYKRVSPILEYFNKGEARYLNGPALSWALTDTPDQIIPPHGLQAIESLLFPSFQKNSYSEISKEISYILKIVASLENEENRIYKFTDAYIWNAIRSSCVRVASLEITGFDSPAALYSLAEAKEILRSMKQIVLIYQPDKSGTGVEYQKLIRLLDRTILYFSASTPFNAFDRYQFLVDYLNPLYKQIILSGKELGIETPPGLHPVNPAAISIFEEDYLNIDFYSPAKEYHVTQERVELGKKLFNDPILSGNKQRSCATCHKPELAFSDGIKLPLSTDGHTLLKRNTPGLWNSAFQTLQFYDSRADLLENQLDEVVHNTNEMGGSLKENAAEIKKMPVYQELFAKAYPAEANQFAPYNIANAISSYVRSLRSFNSKFDRVMRREKDSHFTISEKNGFNLFAGKAKCATCHFIPVFNGLLPPHYTDTESEVLGVPSNPSKLKPELDSDMGKFDFTGSEIHKFAFKTPGLRNIALTAPYMHNGVFNTLDEVVDFYNNGGGAGLGIAPENMTLPPDKLNLTKKEMKDIVSFMKTLTDTTGRK